VSLLSSDSHRIESWAVNFCANNKKLLQVVADGGGNIHVMQYDKEVSSQTLTAMMAQSWCAVVLLNW
jgi:hypothetical protein